MRRKPLFLAFLLVISLSGLLFGLSLYLQPTQTRLGLFVILGASLLGAASFLSGLNDTYDLVGKSLGKRRKQLPTHASQDYNFDDISVVFESKPSYPILEFSILNCGDVPTQISAIHIVKVASIKDEHGLKRYLLGARTKLDFRLQESANGSWQQVFGNHQVASLQPGESEAFQLTLECMNTVNLLDIRIEFISLISDKPQVAFPKEMIAVHSPPEDFDERGTITILNRAKALEAVLDNGPIELWPDTIYQHCPMWYPLFLRGASHLCLYDDMIDLKIFKERFEKDFALGPILASFGENLQRLPIGKNTKTLLSEWIMSPSKLTSIPVWDNENHAEIVLLGLLETIPSSEQFPFLFRVLDSTFTTKLPVDLTVSEENLVFSATWLKGVCEENLINGGLGNVRHFSLVSVRQQIISRIVEKFGNQVIDLLILLVSISRNDYAICNEKLEQLTKLGVEDNTDYLKTVKFWKEWDRVRRKKTNRYRDSIWKAHCLRLSNLYDLTQASTHQIKEFLNAQRKLDEGEKLALANNSWSDSKDLSIIAMDSSTQVKIAILQHTNCSREILLKLMKDTEKTVRSWVAGHTLADETILWDFKDESEFTVLMTVADNPNCPQELLTRLADNDVTGVVKSVLANPNCPIELIYSKAISENDELIKHHAREILAKMGLKEPPNMA